jgi:hypothetical protein
MLKKLQDMVIDCMRAEGYGICEAIEVWNELYNSLKTLPSGKHIFYIGKQHEITVTKQ